MIGMLPSMSMKNTSDKWLEGRPFIALDECNSSWYCYKHRYYERCHPILRSMVL